MRRKCAYTNLDAITKDSIIPKELLGDEDHNWCKSVPCSHDYKNTKQNKLPTDLEMDICECFHLLELSKLRVRYFELKLEDLQSQAKTQVVVKKGKSNRDRIEKKMRHLQSLVENSNSEIEKYLSHRFSDTIHDGDKDK